MAFIVEQAGGKATTGFERILNIQPEKLHQTVPVYIGSKNMVEKAEFFLKEYGDEYGNERGDERVELKKVHP